MPNLKPTDVVIANPKEEGFNEVVENCRTALENIPWVEQSYGRAFLLPERIEEEIYQYPQVYLGAGQYFNVMPNDAFQAFTWMIGKGAASGNEFDEPASFSRIFHYNKRMDVIAFINLKQVDPTKNFIYTEELAFDLLDALNTVRGVTIIEYYLESLEDVYGDYTLKPIDRDLLMFPFAGVRVVTEVKYLNSCDPNATVATFPYTFPFELP